MGIFQPGQNVWRIEQANRASVLIDACTHFAAVRAALLQARRSAFIIGWDLDSRTRLVGDCAPDDGWPVTLREFLTRLVDQRPDLTVYLLGWDFALLYALEREPLPSLALGWNTPDRVRFRLDNTLPVGASHHQKIIVIDDALAFSGGLDLTIRRWDTCAHAIDNADRRDPGGQPYRPFHDVQMMVDGAAARALGELARERWMRSAGESVPPVDGHPAPWPQDVRPDFTNVQVAIARTLPEYGGQAEVREVEALFCDMIASAERTIYIENQFLTSGMIAQALARRLNEKPKLDALLVAPRTHDSWLEAHTMRNGRIRFVQILREAGIADRVRLVYPEVRGGDRVTDTMVHSKVMIVDDRLLRIGSANLNNRSMGTDTECDLALEAASEAERAAIRNVRARLIADHCGVSTQEAAEAIAAHGSPARAAGTLSGNGHRLRPVDDGTPDEGEFAAYLQTLADPERPIESSRVISDLLGPRIPRARAYLWLKLAAAPLMLLALALAWQFPPLSNIASLDQIGPMLQSLALQPWAPLLVIGVYAVGGLIAFPVLILIAATAAAFGPGLGLAYAAAGSMASAAVTYAVGLALGRDTLRAVIGPRLKRVQRRIVRGGVVAIAAIRLVPIAPFTVVNLVAGASDIRLGAFMAGTIIGMLPGWLVMSALGHQLMRIVSAPSATDVALLAVVIAIWIALAGGVQLAFARFGPRS
ncbi:MAG: phospholipase [Alphaproteobacteria bacterium]|nr:MAG: phospholipase [Alphaproteobacteria bacterium]